MQISRVRDLEVYKLAFETAMEIYNITSLFQQKKNIH